MTVEAIIAGSYVDPEIGRGRSQPSTLVLSCSPVGHEYRDALERIEKLSEGEYDFNSLAFLRVVYVWRAG